MDTLQVKLHIPSNENLNQLTAFVNDTKAGSFTQGFEITEAKIHASNSEIEKTLAFVDEQPVLFFGLSY